MKNKIFKTLIGIISFVFTGIITVTLFRPVLNSFIKVEMVLDLLQITFNIIMAIQLYRIIKRCFFNDKNKGLLN